MKMLLTLIFLAGTAWGQMLQAVSTAQAPTTGDSCTGSLTFSWHMETTDVTTGTPAGCSVGDTTTTASGGSTPVISGTQFKDGSNAAYYSTFGDEYSFTVTTEDIIKHTTGTIDIWIYVTTFSDAAQIVQGVADGSNRVTISMRTVTNNQFRLAFVGGGNADDSNTSIGGGFSLNTWYHVIAEWDTTTAHGGNYAQICADTSTGTTNCGTYGTTLDTFTGSITSLSFGQASGSAQYYLDIGKVYSSWN